jgi:hypothetical protein
MGYVHGTRSVVLVFFLSPGCLKALATRPGVLLEAIPFYFRCGKVYNIEGVYFSRAYQSIHEIYASVDRHVPRMCRWLDKKNIIFWGIVLTPN